MIYKKPEATVKSIAPRGWTHSFSLACWPHPGPHQDLLLGSSSLWIMCTSWCLDPCSLSSEHITWSWRTGIVSPAPFRSPSWSFSCHTAAGEPSQNIEDRNWPIVDLGQFKLRQSSWESGRLYFLDNPKQEVTTEPWALWQCCWLHSFPWFDRVVLLKPLVAYPSPSRIPVLSNTGNLCLSFLFPMENWLKKVYKNYNLISHFYTSGKLTRAC